MPKKIVPQGEVTISAAHYFEILRRVERLENLFKMEMPYSLEPRTYEQTVNVSFSPNDTTLMRELFDNLMTEKDRARLEAAGFELKESNYHGCMYVQPSRAKLEELGILDRVEEYINSHEEER